MLKKVIIKKERRMTRGILNRPDRSFFFFLFLLIPIFISCYIYGSLSSWLIPFAILFTSLIEVPILRIRTKRPNYTKDAAELIREIYDVPVEEEMPDALTYNSSVTLNVGGFILPILLAAYIILSSSVVLEIIIVSLVMIIATYMLSEIRNGIGVIVPAHVSLSAPLIAFIVAPSEAIAAVILASGVIGISIGIIARLFGMKEDEGSAFFNIGGVGSFDAVYVCVILSMLASFFV